MRALITGETAGTLYLLCFDQVIGNVANTRAMAKHYLGFCTDLDRRLKQHAAGTGQPITAAAVEKGIGWQVFYRPGTPALERYLKGSYKQANRLCPRCAIARHWRPSYGFQPLDQLALDLDSDELPDVVQLGRAGWAEIQAQAAARRYFVSAPTEERLAAIDDLL